MLSRNIVFLQNMVSVYLTLASFPNKNRFKYQSNKVSKNNSSKALIALIQKQISSTLCFSLQTFKALFLVSIRELVACWCIKKGNGCNTMATIQGAQRPLMICEGEAVEMKTEFSDLKAEHSDLKRDVDVILDKLLAL